MNIDVAVLGSGFGGTLTALVAQKLGLNVAVLDRVRHPRFAIGESSTPLADRILGEVAERYELDALKPLTTYGSWKQTYPFLNVGRKRGFTYLQHRPMQSPSASDLLMVAASASDEVSDTHWYRADVDAWLARQCKQAGVPVFESFDAAIEQQSNGRWQITNRLANASVSPEPDRIVASLIVDATGPAGIVPKTLGVQSVPTSEFRTHSAAVFGHWHGLPKVASFAGVANRPEFPFAIDDAAVHHMLEEGWMWQLRFDDNRVSVGVCFDGEDAVTPEWLATVAFKYPALAMQIAAAKKPPEHVQGTGRLQRRLREIAGENWVALPHTVGFVDPMHSKGIAMTLAGVQRLGRALEQWKPGQPQPIADWGQGNVLSELSRMDRLVSLAYRTRRDARSFEAAILLYTACAMASETSPEENAELFVDRQRVLDSTITDFEHRLDSKTSTTDNLGSDLLQLVRRHAASIGNTAISEPEYRGIYSGTATKS